MVEAQTLSSKNNTLYYDDEGADFVPWANHLLSEVRPKLGDGDAP